MPNAEKFTAVAELTEQFNSSAAAVITEYRGLTVKQVTDLRRALGTQTTYAVVKNTLTKRAAADAGVTIADTLLTGPTAIAFIGGDPVEAAKSLRDFARTNPLLVIKGGLLDGKSLSPAEVDQIADLESREVLLAKLAGALKALPSRAVGLFQAPLSQMARLARALEDKKPQVDEAVADTPPAVPAADAAPPAADEPASPPAPDAASPAAAEQIDPPAADPVDPSTADTVEDTSSVTITQPATAADVPAAPASQAPAEPAE